MRLGPFDQPGRAPERTRGPPPRERGYGTTVVSPARRRRSVPRFRRDAAAEGRGGSSLTNRRTVVLSRARTHHSPPSRRIGVFAAHRSPPVRAVTASRSESRRGREMNAYFRQFQKKISHPISPRTSLGGLHARIASRCPYRRFPLNFNSVSLQSPTAARLSHRGERTTEQDLRNVNDPSAGSPTETLLRLLLPLNDQVWSSSRQHRQCRDIAAHQSEDLTKSFNR